MAKIYHYEVDADGICLTPCPHHMSYHGERNPFRIGSWAEREDCPYFCGDDNSSVVCNFPSKRPKKKAEQ